MKQAKVLFDFVLFALNLKVIFFRTVLLRLTGNPFFTDPDVSLNDAKIATDLLDNAIQASQDGGASAVRWRTGQCQIGFNFGQHGRCVICRACSAQSAAISWTRKAFNNVCL